MSPEPFQPPASSLKGARVLVIDDTALIRRTLVALLEQAGCYIEQDSTGTAGLRRAREMQPDLILLDVQLPDINGVEVARQLRELEATARIPILHVSATHTTGGDHARGMSFSDAYLVHPIDPLVLLSTAGALVRTKRAMDRMAQLQAFTTAVASVDTQQAVAALLVQEGVRAADAGAATLALVNDRGALEIIAASPTWPAALGSIEEPISMSFPSPLTLCVWTGEPLWLTSTEALHRQFPHLAELPGGISELHGIACLPLTFGGRTAGVVAFLYPDAHPLMDVERIFLSTLVAGCTIALERSRLHAEQRRVEEALRVSVQAREDLLAIVSHDLRGPLSLIVTGSAMLEKWAGTEGEIAHAQLGKIAGRLSSAGARMNTLIDDLLDAARLETGQFPLQCEPNSIEPLIQEVLELFAPAAAAKSISLQREVHDDLLAVCDRKRIVQVLSNLVGNAIKFTPVAGEVRVRGTRHGDHVRIAVSDTGVGVPEDELQHLFDRYWTSRREGTGTGLGLFIVNGLIEAHGGTVHVESQPGEGSTFAFTLPVG